MVGRQCEWDKLQLHIICTWVNLVFYQHSSETSADINDSHIKPSVICWWSYWKKQGCWVFSEFVPQKEGATHWYNSILDDWIQHDQIVNPYLLYLQYEKLHTEIIRTVPDFWKRIKLSWRIFQKIWAQVLMFRNSSVIVQLCAYAKTKNLTDVFELFCGIFFLFLIRIRLFDFYEVIKTPASYPGSLAFRALGSLLPYRNAGGCSLQVFICDWSNGQV